MQGKESIISESPAAPDISGSRWKAGPLRTSVKVVLLVKVDRNASYLDPGQCSGHVFCPEYCLRKALEERPAGRTAV